MPNIQVRLRRGSATDHDTTSGGFTGAEGEVTVDTTNDTLRVHDGTTAGGVRLAKYSELSAGSPSQTWTNQTSSRAIGQIETNTTGNTISVNAQIYANAGSNSAPGLALQVNTGTTGSPVWLTIDDFNEELSQFRSAAVGGLIPDGIEYKVILTSSTNLVLVRWVELR
jgi:hypothetical protein